MRDIEKRIARLLLQINAIKLNPAKPFTWSSGWKSPIYCDNRLALSYPEVRNEIKNSFTEIVKLHFPKTELITGVATGAIAHAALVADHLHLPFAYVRPQAKNHGLANKIEGKLLEHQKVLVIEDLVSTGKSSLAAVDALKNANCQVLGMTSIFTYGFKVAVDNFSQSGVTLIALSNYDTLIEEASAIGYITISQLENLKRWRTDPQNWLNTDTDETGK
jgi:orotate phosphoribosyltransferase